MSHVISVYATTPEMLSGTVTRNPARLAVKYLYLDTAASVREHEGGRFHRLTTLPPVVEQLTGVCLAGQPVAYTPYEYLRADQLRLAVWRGIGNTDTTIAQEVINQLW